MLDRLFGSSSRAKIIKFFCTHSDEKYYVRELARVLDVQLNALSRELDNLKTIGFLAAYVSDHRKYYMVNKDFPLLTELKSLIVKSMVLLEHAVTSELRSIKGLTLFVLTGVFINQDMGTDILLVGSVDRKKVQKLIHALSQSFYQDLRFTMLSPQEYKYRIEVTDKFVYSILNQSPIVIINKYTR